MAYFDDNKTSVGNTTTANLPKKCIICEMPLNYVSDKDVCEKCKAESEHIMRILAYLKISTKDIKSNNIPITKKNDNEPKSENIPLTKGDSRRNLSNDAAQPPPKVYTGTTVLGQDNNFYTGTLDNDIPVIAQKKAWLVSVRTNEKVEISKPFFTIGKMRDEVDFWVSGNKAVSRKHAKVIYKDNEYFIMDNNSLNSTYLNAKPLKPFIETEIKNNDSLCFGDEDFKFYIE